MSIGERIRQLRESHSLTQEELANKLNTSKQTIYKYENQIISTIPYDKVEIIANFFNVSPSYLVGWEDNTPTNTGKLIHKLRVENNMTLEELGKKVGVGKSTVRKWETGMIANMKKDKILKVAEALGTTPEYIMGWEEGKMSEIKSTNVGNRIKERRQALGFTAEQLAGMLHKNKATIYRYENGEIENLPHSVLIPIAKALNTTVDYLLTETTDEHQDMMGLANTDNGIIKRIKERRIELGYSYQDLADKTNMSKSTLQRYESGAIKNLPLDKLNVLANALYTTPLYLLGTKNKYMTNLTDEEFKLINKYRAVKDDDVKFSVNLILDMANTVEEYNSNLDMIYRK